MSAAAYDLSALETAELTLPGPRPETRSYRGASLEELLPRIQQELGPDAIIVRRREGVVGGFGGFFGKKCIELQVQAAVQPAAAAPRSRSFYDTGDQIALPSEVLDAALAQKESFAALLASATEQTSEQAPDDEEPWDFAPAPSFEMEPAVEAEEDEEQVGAGEPEPEPAAELALDVSAPGQPVTLEAPSAADELAFFVEPLEAEPTPLSPPAPDAAASNARAWAARELEKIRAGARSALEQPGLSLVPAPQPERTLVDELLAAGLSVSVASALAEDVGRDFLPFGTKESPRAQARTALSRRIPVSHDRRTQRRVVALVGAAGAGKTLAAAKLARAYARGAGLSVGLLSCEPFGRTLALAALVDGLPVAVETAEAAGQIRFALPRLADRDLVVVDTPALDPDDAASVERVARILRAVRPTETHLVVPAGTSAAAVRALVATLKAPRLLVSHADTRRPLGELAALAVAEGTPFSYVSRGAEAGAGIAPADPSELAGMVLP